MDLKKELARRTPSVGDRAASIADNPPLGLEVCNVLGTLVLNPDQTGRTRHFGRDVVEGRLYLRAWGKSYGFQPKELARVCLESAERSYLPCALPLGPAPMDQTRGGGVPLTA
jgi:hypothetical protein